MSILNLSIKVNKSQGLAPIFLISVILLIVFLILDYPFELKLAAIGILGISPFFIRRPIYYLYFLLLVTPSLRSLMSNADVLEYFNFNALIHVFLLLFGALAIWKARFRVLGVIKKYDFVKFLLGFVLISVISIIYSLDKTNSLNHLIRLLSSTLVIFLFSLSVVESRKDFYNLLLALVVGAIIPGVVGYYEFFTNTGWYDVAMREYRINGTFLHPVIFSGYMMFALPVLYALSRDESQKNNRFVYCGLIVSNIFLSIASFTRGVWNAILWVLVLMGAIKNKRLLISGILILLLMFVVIEPINERVLDVVRPGPDSSFQTRLNIIKATLPAFSAAPVLGHAYGSFERVHLDYNEEAQYWESLQAHNDYLRVLIELGSIGLLCYLMIFITLFYLIRKLYIVSRGSYLEGYVFSLMLVWVAAAVLSMSDNFLRIVEFQQITWVYTGAVIGVVSLKDKV